MRSQPAETAAPHQPPAASRGEYLRRRRSTPAGLQELRRFRRTAIALAAYTAAVAAAVRLDLIAVTADEVTTAWEDLATDRLLTTAAVKAAAALAVALTAPWPSPLPAWRSGCGRGGPTAARPPCGPPHRSDSRTPGRPGAP